MLARHAALNGGSTVQSTDGFVEAAAIERPRLPGRGGGRLLYWFSPCWSAVTVSDELVDALGIVLPGSRCQQLLRRCRGALRCHDEQGETALVGCDHIDGVAML